MDECPGFCTPAAGFDFVIYWYVSQLCYSCTIYVSSVSVLVHLSK